MILSILVISRSKVLLNQLLESISRATNLEKENIEILCSWNGSKNNESKIINNTGYKFKIAQRNKYHFASNMNSLAKKASGEILCIINDDIILDNNSIDAGIKALKSNSNIGIVSGNLRYGNGLIQHIGTSFNDKDLSYHKFKKSLKHDSNIIDNTNLIISAATGALLLIKKSIFNEIGFNEKYYQSGEDVELSLEVREEKGLNIYLCKKMSGIHFESVSRKKKTESIYKEKDMKRLQKRRLKFINNVSKNQLLIDINDLQNQITIHRIMEKNNRLKNPIKILKRFISKFF